MKFEQLTQAKKVLLYGYGVEGQSTEAFLKSHFPHIQVDLYDDNFSESGLENKTFQKKSELCFTDYSLVIHSPGIPREKITGIEENKITSQTELFFENISEDERQKIIGITGTKGKSTTTQFCTDLLTNAGKTAKIAGNFGVPPLELLDELKTGDLDFIVFEISSFQLEHLQTSPHIAIFLNLFGDHLERHGTVEDYFLAKSNIFRYQINEDFLIMPEVSGKLLEFSRGNGRFVLSQELEEDLFAEDSVFRAKHFRQNLGTMRTLCQILKIEESVLEKTAQEFKGLSHRMELFVEKNGIRFVNDSIASNPTAAMAAVRFFGRDLGSIILGGKPSGDSWEGLLTLLLNETESIILLPNGDSLGDIIRTCEEVNFPSERIVHAECFEEIVTLAKEKTPTGKVCLLSPGAKSFDCFKSYREKGDVFKKLVNEIE
jgi:UDP-N-acetylmuramoyl-L-alanine---L-glutamate ligase